MGVDSESASSDVRSVGASEFRRQCLALLDSVEATKTSVLVTKRGRPVALLVPVDEPGPATMGSVELLAAADRDYFSTGVDWSAELEPQG
ncbi:MAG: type II toxin-antitoxin system Phd/YefM family antitoxin [Acidimicrobiales bacterium]